jgi:hypothetical protein
MESNKSSRSSEQRNKRQNYRIAAFWLFLVLLGAKKFLDETEFNL